MEKRLTKHHIIKKLNSVSKDHHIDIIYNWVQYNLISFKNFKYLCDLGYLTNNLSKED